MICPAMPGKFNFCGICKIKMTLAEGEPIKQSASISCHSEERSDEESTHNDRAKIFRLRSG